jgi:pyrroloquinoline quinone biosynthesis protein E
MKSSHPPLQLREIKLEVTHRCPLACVHCSSDADPSCSREMNEGGCLRILSQAARLGVEQVAFSGGEPLIWNSIGKAISAASKVGLKVSVYTSGNVDEIHSVLEFAQQQGLSRAVFSLFGATSSTHERITRRRGSLKRR